MIYFALLLGLPIEIMFIVKGYSNLKLWYLMLIDQNQNILKIAIKY